MANPSLYKPRRTQPPEIGPEVDTSVNYLLGGVVALALLLVALVGTIGYTTMKRPTLDGLSGRASTERAQDNRTQAARPQPDSSIDIGSPAEAPAVETRNR